MLFVTPFFIFYFLPLFILTYYIALELVKNLVALLFSLVFYAWGEPVFIAYILAGTALDYLIVKHVLTNPAAPELARKSMLAVAIVINVAALLFFKYANFLVDQVQPWIVIVFDQPFHIEQIALPLGISFITFHKISFVIDLFKNHTQPPRSFLNALLYILVFPQLVAGPIVRVSPDPRADHRSSAF